MQVLEDSKARVLTLLILVGAQLFVYKRTHLVCWLVGLVKKKKESKNTRRKCEFTGEENLQVSTEAGTSDNMKHASADSVISSLKFMSFWV